MTNQYAKRDITSDELMQLYMDHVNAMTGEGLHSKSDIAAELAYRDARIAELEEREQALASLLLQYRDAHIDLTNAEVCDDGWNRLLTPMMLSRLDAIANHSPGYSLACRDLLQRADELETLADRMPMMSSMRAKEALRLRARELRKQAEGQQ